MKRRQSSVLLGALALVSSTSLFAAACGGGDDDDANGGNGNGGNGNGQAEGGADSGIHLDLGGMQGMDVGGDSSQGQGGDCGATRFEANPTLVNVLIVVDRSHSMTEQPQGFSTDKWAALRGALETTFDQTKANISYGLDLYPYSGKSGVALDNQCQMPTGNAVVVPIQPGDEAGPLILGALDDNPPEGGTPTAAALLRAHAYFTTGAGKALKGDKYVLLATDGGPNCNAAITCDVAHCTDNMDGKSCGPGANCCDKKLDPDGPSKCLDEDASVAAVAKLTTAGIKTIVVGIPGTEAYEATLDALADKSPLKNPEAPPSYFSVSAKSGVKGLANALAGITTGLVKSCTLNLDSAPPDPSRLFVVIDGVELGRNATDGFEYQASPPAVQILGKTCEHLKANGAEYINVTYGCADFRPPVK